MSAFWKRLTLQLNTLFKLQSPLEMVYFFPASMCVCIAPNYFGLYVFRVASKLMRVQAQGQLRHHGRGSVCSPRVFRAQM